MKSWHRIIIGDSRRMSRVEDESVHLIVTSPPYFQARDYGVAHQIGFTEPLHEYLESVGKVFAECYRVLRPGRRFCLNISDIPAKGQWGVRWIPLGPFLLAKALELGFELADRIIWFKTPMKGFNYGSLPYPPSPLICDSMEYIWVLRKPGKENYSYVRPQDREASKLSPDEYGEYTKQIWSIRRVRLKDNINGHIAPFPIELPLRCIKLYSFVGDTVLDPFGGRGTTTKAAADAGRNSVLYEINPEYLEKIKDFVGMTQARLDHDLKFEVFFDLEYPGGVLGAGASQAASVREGK